MSARDITLRLVDGPVTIPSLAGKGISRSFVIWSQINAREEYPASAGSANYVLQLSKSVNSYKEVDNVASELQETLLLLAQAWPYSGGTNLLLHTITEISDTRVESNADAVKNILMKEVGLQSVSKQLRIGYKIIGNYTAPPLESAIRIARHCKENKHLKNVLHYYYQASLKQNDWYSSLYKIKDVLIEAFGGAKKAKQIVSKDQQWSTFENILNNHDLRHPGKDAKATTIDRSQEQEVFSIAYEWIMNALLCLVFT